MEDLRRVTKRGEGGEARARHFTCAVSLPTQVVLGTSALRGCSEAEMEDLFKKQAGLFEGKTVK